MSYNSEGCIQTISCNDFKQYIQKSTYYPPSTISFQALIAYIQHHVTDNDFVSIQNDIISYSNYLTGKEGSNKNSSVLFAHCHYDHSLIINLCIHIECFQYESNHFHPLFLAFTANTFAMFTASDRRLCFENVIHQFESTDEVMDDLDGYSFTDNLSDIMDAMDFEDKKKANSFANELKKAIQSASMHEKHACQEIALSMFRLWDVWLNPQDQTIQQITNLLHIITPKKFMVYRDIFIQRLIKLYLQFPEQNCSAFMKAKMNKFMLAEYGLDNYCDIGTRINTKLLPYMPILTHLLNNNKLHIRDVKLVQMLFLVVITRGIPKIINILNKTDHDKVIHLDIALVFNTDIIKSIKKLVSNKSKNFLKPVKIKKIKHSNYFKENNYFNFDNAYNYLFAGIIDSLNRLHKEKQTDCDLIRIYIDMTKPSSQYYPAFFVEMTNGKVELNGKTDICSALLARKRYESDIIFVRESVANKNSDHDFMLLSNIIAPVCGDNDQQYRTSMYLQYALGIMKFIKDDIYSILPKLFECGTMDQNTFLTKYDDKVRHLEDDIFNESLGKFNRFISDKI